MSLSMSFLPKLCTRPLWATEEDSVIASKVWIVVPCCSDKFHLLESARPPVRNGPSWSEYVLRSRLRADLYQPAEFGTCRLVEDESMSGIGRSVRIL